MSLLLLPLALLGPAVSAQDADDLPGAGLPPSQEPPAPGGEESKAGWSVAPAGPDGPGLRAAFTYNVEPGQTFRDSVSISNLSPEPITFAIYAKDAYNTEVDAAFALLDDPEENEGVGSWITLRTTEYEIPSGKRADIPFEVTIPEDALPGDHAGGIIAANVDAVDEVEQDGVSVAIRQRVAARMYIRVAGPLDPELRVRDLKVDTETPILPFIGGKGTISYTVENIGNVRLSGATSTRLTGIFGRTVERLENQDLPELLPGGSVSVTETWEGTPPLEYLTAKISVESIDGSTEVRASTGFFVWSWIVLVLVLALVAYVGYRVWRKRRADRPATAAEPPTDDDPDPEPEPVGTGGGTS